MTQQAIRKSLAGDFLRTKREHEDPLNAGIRKALRGESVTNDQSPHRDEWSPEKIAKLAKEQQRREDAIEAGQWPM